MYNAVVQDHFHHPRNVGPLAGATHRGAGGVVGEGPYVVLWLTVADGRIVRGAYQSYGCPAAIASASAAVELLLGRTPAEGRRLTVDELDRALDGLPDAKQHCLHLTLAAAHDALQEA
jgi:NifU-like protein involved in Fe-S cluster formation